MKVNIKKPTESAAMVSQNVAEIIKNHVTLEVEGIDRMYLNGYVPGLQTEGGFVHFVHQHLGFPIASTAVISPLSKAFVQAIEVFAKEQQVDLVAFDKKQRKDELTHEYPENFRVVVASTVKS
jgi:hypothetical protein